jgi:hypothetical protein
MVLTVSSALSPVTGLVCHRRQWSCLRQLDASVGASGPHRFAVREISAFVNALACVHRILPRVRDDLEPPLVWDRTAKEVEVIWVKSEPKYFCEKGWTASRDLPRRTVKSSTDRPGVAHFAD